MPWRLAERSRSTASWPLRGAPLPSRSSRARLCLAIGRLASTALRYHSTARVESRSTTKPRSYITPTLKADCAEPCWAARSSQPAPACWSLGTPMPLHQAARHLFHGGNLVGIGPGPQLVDRQRRPVDRSGWCGAGCLAAAALRRRAVVGGAVVGGGRRRRRSTGEVGAGRFGRGGRLRNHDRCRRAWSRPVGLARGAVSGDRVSQAPAAPAATRIAPPIRRAGRFTPMPQP